MGLALVNTAKLADVIATIDDLLATDYVLVQSLKKRYIVAKNDCDVCAARIENRSGDTQKLHQEMGKATEVYLNIKSDLTDLGEKITKRQDTQLAATLLAASMSNSKEQKPQ